MWKFVLGLEIFERQDAALGALGPAAVPDGGAPPSVMEFQRAAGGAQHLPDHLVCPHRRIGRQGSGSFWPAGIWTIARWGQGGGHEWNAVNDRVPFTVFMLAVRDVCS